MGSVEYREMFLQEQEMRDLLSSKHCWWLAHVGTSLDPAVPLEKVPASPPGREGVGHQSDSVGRGRMVTWSLCCHRRGDSTQLPGEEVCRAAAEAVPLQGQGEARLEQGPSQQSLAEAGGC